MLEVRNVTKEYGNGKNVVRALDDVSINFGAKGLVIILGKSGCGKSTLLNIMGGLDKQTSGDVIINGQNTRTFKSADFDAYRNTYVGIIFQEFNLIDEITVFDNINMTLKLQEKSADVNTVDEALAMVGLSNMGYRKPSELSGGQRQRVALARALLKKPEIILADEPTGALDSSTGEEVFETLKKISETKLVIVVTHNRDLAHAYGDRIIEIADGKITSDRVRISDETELTKELSPQVLRVASGGSVTKQELEQKIDKKKVSYIGISHDKDRVALAYPETFDSFYETVDRAVYQPITDEQIPIDEKPFKLSKGRLPVKEAVKMARASIKLRKKRYRLLTFLTVVCFTFICIAFIIATLSVPSLVSQAAFAADGQPLVSVSKYDNSGYSKIKMSDEDYAALATAGVGLYGKVMELENATPKYASPRSSYGDYFTVSGDFTLNGFTAVIEGAKPSDFGIDILAGSENVVSVNDVVISDMSAYELMCSGYVGYNAAGEYGVHYPINESELVGARFLMDTTNQLYKIVGIYKTDYASYRSVVTASPMDLKAGSRRETLRANKDFLYSKFFAAEGFGGAYASAGNSQSSNFGLNFMLRDDDSGVNYYMYSNAVSGAMAFNPDEFAENPDSPFSTKKLIWAQNGGSTNPLLPDAIAENEFILPASSLSSAVGIYNDEDALVQSEEFLWLMQKEYRVTVTNAKGGTIKTIDNAKIVGVVSDYGAYGAIVSAGFEASLSNSVKAYDYVMIGKGATRSSLQTKLSKLEKSGYAVGVAKASDDAMNALNDSLGVMAQVFMYFALGFLVFALLVILNFMTSSVRFRTKEIAVYRVVGAKSFDVAKIFLAESAFITLRTAIVATILSFVLTLILNSILSSIIGMFSISITLLKFNWLIHPMLILLATALFVVVSSLIPILSITRKKPIDAVKMT